MIDTTTKTISLVEIATALEEVAPLSIVHQAVPTPEIDFVREVVTKNSTVPDDLVSVDDVLLLSETETSFYENLKHNFNKKNINRIEMLTRGQSSNDAWYRFRKGVITASKCHEVLTKMKKLKRGATNVNTFALNQKILGNCFISPDLPALKYGRAMEVNAVNSLYEVLKGQHKKLTFSDCGLFLDKESPFVGATPDKLMSCECCSLACVEVKCPFSINYTTPQEGNLHYLTNENGSYKLKRHHQYFSQCQSQMGITGTNRCYFVVWTPHGTHIELIEFDSVFFKNMKDDLNFYYKNFYRKSIFTDN